MATLHAFGGVEGVSIFVPSKLSAPLSRSPKGLRRTRLGRSVYDRGGRGMPCWECCWRRRWGDCGRAVECILVL